MRLTIPTHNYKTKVNVLLRQKRREDLSSQGNFPTPWSIAFIGGASLVNALKIAPDTASPKAPRAKRIVTGVSVRTNVHFLPFDICFDSDRSLKTLTLEDSDSCL